jgi:DNA mismatch repair ATPase MutS
MLIDAGTLRDLDVLDAATPRGPTIWSLVDRTRSRAGREHLRRRLVEPCGTATAIHERQRAHQALAALSGLDATLQAMDADGVERYLGSTWHLPQVRGGVVRLGDRLWAPAWYRQYLDDVENGQARVGGTLRAADDLRRRLEDSAAGELRAIGVALATELAHAHVQELLALSRGRSRSARLAFDQRARGEAAPRLRAILDAVGRLEAMWSLAGTTAERGWVYPTPSTRLEVRGFVHPFLGDRAVANDLALADGVRVAFLTGPNMAGKSTFLKAIAVALLLAHAGCGVPAASMTFPPAGALFSSVQIADDIGRGESFYLAEVRRVRALAQALRDHGSVLAVIDEPFRGTNVHDAAEATLAVIARLTAHPGALVFVASHLAEVVPALQSDPRVRLLHVVAEVRDAAVRFDYRLREGVSTQRLGMVLLRQEGVLDLLEVR